MTFLCNAYRTYLFPLIHLFHTKLLHFDFTVFFICEYKSRYLFSYSDYLQGDRRVYLTTLNAVDCRWMKHEYGAIVKWYFRRENRSTRRKPLFSDTFPTTYCTCTGMELVTFIISFCSLWGHFIFSNSKLFSCAFKYIAEYSVRIFIIKIRIFSIYNLNLHTYIKKSSSFVIYAVMKINVAYCVGNVEGDITLLLCFCLRNSEWNESKNKKKKSNLSVRH
jgi:hypothetical protein